MSDVPLFAPCQGESATGRSLRIGCFAVGLIAVVGAGPASAGTVVQEYFETGELRGASERVPGDGGESVPHGWAFTFYKSGVVESQQLYHQGIPHGPYLTWYEDGSPEIEVEFVNGLQSGEASHWRQDGSFGEGGFLEEGRTAGDWERYFEDGQLESLVEYEKGVRTGRWIFFNKDGSVAGASE